MTRPCDLLTPYVDGELEPADAETFALHLATCATCPAQLHEALQLVALEASVRGMDGSGEHVLRPVLRPVPNAGDPIPITEARTARRGRGRWLKIAAVGALAAAAAVVLYLALPRGGGPGTGEPAPSTIAIATASTRSIEGRISYSGAAAHRPYRVDRAGGAAASADSISQQTLAQLEQRGDLHGLAAAQLLLGEAERARKTLERAGASPDIESDRALLLLAAGKPADALVALDAILERAPKHAAALWNRALALRDLELPIVAAEAFESAAALGEPGWSDEAKRRAAELTAAIRARKEPFDELFKSGPRLAVEPTAVPLDIARRVPGFTRLYFYDAVRGAASPDLVRQLAPLARELDAAAGSDHLTRYVEQTARRPDFARRRPLAERYAKIVAGERLDAAAARAYLADLRAAKQDDLLLGALIRTSPDGRTVPAPLLPELRRVATASGDPWFALLATEQEVTALLARGDYEGAEVALRRVLATCDQTRLDYRCAKLELQLANTYLATNRLVDASAVAHRMWSRTRSAGEWFLERDALSVLVNLEELNGELGAKNVAIARSYISEFVGHTAANCADQVWGYGTIATMLVNRQDLAGAKRELARAAAVAQECAAARPTAGALFTKVHVLRDGAASDEEIAAARAEIAALRAAAPVTEQAFLDQAEGRLMIDRDRATGIALLARAITTASKAAANDTFARRARAYAYAVLSLDAARAAEWDRVWQLLEDELGFAPAERCTIGVAVEDQRTLVVIRDAAGATGGRYAATRRPPASLFEELRSSVTACPSVEVVARPPAHGDPKLLRGDIAWSYRSGRARAPSAAPAGKGLIIANTQPPLEFALPRLLPWTSSVSSSSTTLTGPSATPSRALAELADASYVEIHVHGMVNTSVADASFLMMSPEAEGRYALTAAAIQRTPLRGRPIVVLAACHAAKTAPFHHQAWSLPAAFIEAGARAVFASSGVIDDADAGAFFDRLHEQLERGVSPSIALRDTRAHWLQLHPGAVWVQSLMVFE